MGGAEEVQEVLVLVVVDPTLEEHPHFVDRSPYPLHTTLILGNSPARPIHMKTGTSITPRNYRINRAGKVRMSVSVAEHDGVREEELAGSTGQDGGVEQALILINMEKH